MEWFGQLLVISLLGVAVSSVLEEGSGEIFTVFLVALTALCLWLLCSPVAAFIKSAAAFLERTDLPGEIFYLLLKATAVAMIARVTAAFCKDASRSALAVLVEFGGALSVLLLSLPLLESVLTLLEGWL